MKKKTNRRNIEIYNKYKLMMSRNIRQYDVLEILGKEYNKSIETIKYIISHINKAM